MRPTRIRFVAGIEKHVYNSIATKRSDDLITLCMEKATRFYCEAEECYGKHPDPDYVLVYLLECMEDTPWVGKKCQECGNWLLNKRIVYKYDIDMNVYKMWRFI